MRQGRFTQAQIIHCPAGYCAAMHERGYQSQYRPARSAAKRSRSSQRDESDCQQAASVRLSPDRRAVLAAQAIQHNPDLLFV